MIYEFLKGEETSLDFLENSLRPRLESEEIVDPLKEPIRAFKVLCENSGIYSKHFEVNLQTSKNNSRIMNAIVQLGRKMTNMPEAEEANTSKARELLLKSLANDAPVVLWSYERLASSSIWPTLSPAVNTECWHDHALVIFGFVDDVFLHYDPADTTSRHLSPIRILTPEDMESKSIYNMQLLKSF